MKNVDEINSKESYLQWRAEWRAQYADLSRTIRELKAMRRFQDQQRGGVKFSDEQVKAMNAQARKLGLEYKLGGSVYYMTPHGHISTAKAQATAMLELRKASKITAQRCFAQERSAVPA